MSEAATASAAPAPTPSATAPQTGGGEAPSSVEPSNEPKISEVSESSLNSGGNDPSAAAVEAAVEQLTPEQIATLEELLPKYKKKLKIDGEERELSWEEIERNVSKGFGADAKFQKAAQMAQQAEQALKEKEITQKQFQTLLHMLQNEPDKLLLDPRLKVNRQRVRQFAEHFLTDALQAELNPEEYETKKRLQEYEELKAREEARIREEEEARIKSAEKEKVDGYKNQYAQVISDTLEKVNVGDKDWAAEKSLQIMMTAAQQGIVDDLTSNDIAELVQESWDKIEGRRYDNVPDDQLLNQLPPDLVKRVQKQLLAQIKTPQVSGATKSTGAEPRASKKQGMTMDEFTEYNKRRLAELG